MSKVRIAKKRKKLGLTKAELARMNVSLQLALARTRLALAQEKQSAARARELATIEAAQQNDLIDLETRAQTRPKGQKAARPGLAPATLESVFWDRGTT